MRGRAEQRAFDKEISVNGRAKNLYIATTTNKQFKNSSGKIIYSIESISGPGRINAQKQRAANRQNLKEGMDTSLTQ